MRGFQDNSPGNGVTKVFQILLQSSHFVTPPSSTTEAFWIGSANRRLTQRADYLILLRTFHVELRRKSILELKAVSLYASLVTSLYFARDLGERSPGENQEHQRIAEFLKEQQALQRNLLDSLRKDPYLRSACSDRSIEYNQKLLAAWDQLSVQLCRNPDSKFSVNDVPTALEKSCRLWVTPVDPNSREIRLEPWPFSKPRVELTCEGHVLDRRFTSEADLRKYLKDARRVSVIYTLTPSPEVSVA